MGPITVSVKMRLEEYDTYNSATGPSRGEGVDKVFAGLRCTSRDPSSATGPSIDTGDPGDPRVSDDVATETVGTDATSGTEDRGLIVSHDLSNVWCTRLRVVVPLRAM